MRRIFCLLSFLFLLTQVAVADVESEAADADVKSEIVESESEAKVAEAEAEVVEPESETAVTEAESEVVEVEPEAAEVESEVVESESEAKVTVAETEVEVVEVETEAAVTDVKSEVVEAESGAEEKLKTSVGKVFTVMSDKELTIDQKKIQVVEITSSVFGYPLMAKLSLGKNHWSQFSPEQRTEFTSLFTRLFQDFYVDKLDLFSDEKVIFQPPIIVSEKKVQIPTVLLSKEKEYSMQYKMAKTKNGWRIYDIEIEGVSLIHTYRSQYNHILESGEIEDLLTKMREKKIENDADHNSDPSS